VALALGSTHLCALLDDESVKCWGDNRTGQLGLGDTAWWWTMGDSLPAVDLEGIVVQLTAGGGHTCALFNNGRKYAPPPLSLTWMCCVRLA